MSNIPSARLRLIEKISIAAKRARLRTKVDRSRFITQYYRGVAEDDLAEYSFDTLANAALAHLRFAARRARNEILVRVYNPTVEHDGWTSTHSVVEITTDDMPFLVDSLRLVLDQSGRVTDLMIHPIMRVKRDRSGTLLGVVADTDEAAGLRVESWQRVEIDRLRTPEEMEQLTERLRTSLNDVRLACTDWSAMRERARAVAAGLAMNATLPKSETDEAREFLAWLDDNHFTFLGYREYRLVRAREADALEALPDTGLGILRSRRGRKLKPKTLSGEAREQARNVRLLIITKANSIATVHRATYLDYIGVKTFDARGRVTGEHRFLGLFTSSAYHVSPREIPLLRSKVDAVIAHFGLASTSHDGKALLNVLETYPRDELFHTPVAELVATVRGIVNLYERQRVRVFLRRDVIGRFISCLIYVPRDRYNTQVRHRMEAVIRERLGAAAIESQVQLSESSLARLHMIVRTQRGMPTGADIRNLEIQLADTTRTWNDDLSDALRTQLDENTAWSIGARYQNAFPAAYQAEVDAATAVADIEQIEVLTRETDGVLLRAMRANGTMHLRLLRSATPIPLSDALPVFENMGLTVLTERPYEITLSGQRAIWLQDFEVRTHERAGADLEAAAERFSDAFLAIWHGRAESDGFNRLVLEAGLTWRQAAVLRAYARYLVQTNATFSQAYMERVLIKNRKIAAHLSALFEAQFDPALVTATRNRRLAKLQPVLDDLFEQITSLDEDRIVRRFHAAIDATLRTNYYQIDAHGASKSYLSLKLDSRRIPELPLPKPFVEVFVYSPRVEAVHLRMGAVARGGIRWSDRREDFRTEVLGLMKAQNVKNTVIVPVGAKGGFVPKALPANATRDDVQREVVECYRTFIRGLLDITDNLKGERVIPPARVVRRDGDDPYLVVAADKGTATFSDIANRISAEYGFWLGDAFASGGSAGYDHKKMAITARGAWECVRRHFREFGVDTQAQTFTVAGIGDMSGDVFGNGLLQSKHARLLAAFNHQHIFIDPDPSPADSYAERERLFKLPRSTWDDYNRKAMSKGAGIYRRDVKSIRISPQAKTMLALASDTITPLELIRAVLRMSVDLLWNGGIGTYVKASSETDADVGDKTNDSVRVDAKELRCKVVGEGGNLGFSQLGRIEYAAHGGRINTDFIDNSGGVDCSDHEVNIKILLNVAGVKLTAKERDRLLVRMTDEVAQLVLRDNYLQTQSISMMEARASQDLLEHAYLIRSLEQTGQLDRALEFLPSLEEIEERHKTGRGLTRPELAISLCYAKMALYARLIESDVPEDPYLSQELERYFPALLRQRFRRRMHRHRLQREIVATATTNSLVNRMGAPFARRAQEDTGADAAKIARAYSIAREAFRMRDVWAQIEALDNRIVAAEQYAMMRETTRLLRFSTYGLLHRQPDSLNIETEVARLRPGLQRLTERLPQVVKGVDLQRFEATRTHFTSAGVPAALSTRIAGIATLYSGMDLVEISTQADTPIEAAAAVYFELGTALSLDWLRGEIEKLSAEGHWQSVARGTLRDNSFSLQRAVCLQALELSKRGGPDEIVAAWLDKHRTSVDYARQSVDEMRKLQSLDFATLSVALQAVRRLTE
jgi:glutamate dehydrogenase